MVYGFVRQSEGHVTLYSELGLGTSFGLYFPGLPAQDEQGDAPVPNDAQRVQRGAGQTVLIVEDNAKVRKLSRARIRDLGFATIEAEDGDQAYQILKEGAAVDIVFSDLVMPGKLNGYDLALKIAAEFPALKVLLTSGYASDVITKSLAQGQSYEILHKPYRQSVLADRLHALLDAQGD
jgi:CheY-like chemotaxis protein